MNKKSTCILTVLLSGAVLLGGCQETPDSVIVKPKGREAIEQYEEDESREESGEEQQGLREKLGVPERFQDEIVLEDGKVTLTTDAVIELPKAPGFSTIEVSAVPLTQDFMDRITQGLFPEGKIYSSDSYFVMTKDDCQKEINKIKAEMAQASTESEDEEEISKENLQNMLEELEAAYAEAPETAEKKEVSPLLAVDESGFESFSGVVEIPEPYFYRIFEGSGDSIRVRVSHYGENEAAQPGAGWGEYQFAKDDIISQIGSEDEIKSSAGISYEEAKKIADDKISAIGVSDMDIGSWDYAVYMYRGNEGEEVQVSNTGYMFYYTRRIGSTPIIYTLSEGGGLEDMDSTIEPWTYETLKIVVSKNGLEELSYVSPYEIGKTQVENVKLLDFEEIKQIYTEMMQYKVSSQMDNEYLKEYKVTVDRITLGYTRIYSPAQDSRSGLLVPVWDFFGNSEMTLNDQEGTRDASSIPNNSLFTINAIDGTIIDRGLGY